MGGDCVVTCDATCTTLANNVATLQTALVAARGYYSANVASLSTANVFLPVFAPISSSSSQPPTHTQNTQNTQNKS